MATFTFKDKKAQKEPMALPPSKKKISFKNIFYRAYMVITVVLLAYIAVRVS